MGDVWSLVGMLAAAAAILALAYVTTRWIASRGGSLPGGASGGPGIVWQAGVGRNERLVLLRLGERYLLLGVTAGGISLLAELTPEEAGQWSPGAGAPVPPSFLEALRSNLSKRK